MTTTLAISTQPILDPTPTATARCVQGVFSLALTGQTQRTQDTASTISVLNPSRRALQAHGTCSMFATERVLCLQRNVFYVCNPVHVACTCATVRSKGNAHARSANVLCVHCRTRTVTSTAKAFDKRPAAQLGLSRSCQAALKIAADRA